MKKTVIYTTIVIALIVSAVITGLRFNSLGGDSIDFSLDGGYAFQEKTLSVKKGVVIFSVSDEARFLVKSEISGQGVIAPWSEIMFIAVSTPFEGEIVKISAQECKLFVPMDGDLKIRIGYNPVIFNPLIDKIWTGKEEAGNFKAESLKIQVRNITDGKYAKVIPDVESLPKPKPKIKTPTVVVKTVIPVETDEIFSQVRTVVGILIGDEQETIANEQFLEAKIDSQKVQEIKDRVAGAWSVGEDLIGNMNK
jgi:hypothetical protein